MPNVVTTNAENLTSIITVTIPREDYETALTNKIKQVKREASVKGFRKGKVPMSFIKKHYSKSIFAELINKMMEENIMKALSETSGNHLGQPMPIESDVQYNFDVDNLEDFEFQFEIGNKPTVEVKGLDDGKEFLEYVINVPDSTIEKEIANVRQRMGERIIDEEKILDGDMVKFRVIELVDGDAIKADGVQSEFSMLWDRIADEDLKKELLGKKTGDTVKINIFNIEKDSTAEHVKKYHLGLGDTESEVGEMYEGTITEVSRIELKEMNEEFFTAAFGPDVKTEEEAKATIEKAIKEQYAKSTDAILYREIQDHVEAVNKETLPLPDDYMKRWLLAASDENTAETVEKGYTYFANDLRWSMITNTLAEKYEIQVTEQDIRDSFAERITQYMGGYAMGDFLETTVTRMMGDEKSVEDTAKGLVTDRVMAKLKAEVKLKQKEVTTDEFQEIIKEINEKVQAERAAAEADA